MKTLSSALFSVVMVTASTAWATPKLNVDNKITLDLREADLFNVFRLLGEVSKMNVIPDACVKDDKVDLLLRNTPVSTVFDVLGSRLSLTYRVEGNTVLVGCASSGAVVSDDSRLETRISVEVKDVPLEEVLRAVARSSGLTAAKCNSGCDTKVSLLLKSVRARTVLAALADMSGLRFSVADNVLTADQGAP